MRNREDSTRKNTINKYIDLPVWYSIQSFAEIEMGFVIAWLK